MRLRPVEMSEIVAGQPYVEMEVWVNGNMALKTHVFYGQPIKHDGIWCMRVAPRSELRDIERKLRGMMKLGRKVLRFHPSTHHSMSDRGLDPNRRSNGHRVFRHNMENMRALEDLVRRQALREYLELIGENVDEFITRLRPLSASSGIASRV